ncbi:hypothetical protein JZ785_16240 [Alicyclobacillus curvatus]|nr:hypothetical protein JZ785_16240 [Alicyclobacillus curvatus]
MTWIAVFFVAGTIAHWVVVKPKHKLQDWLVQIALLTMGVAFSVLVDLDIWPNLDPLLPLKAIFMPMTQWIYNHV